MEEKDIALLFYQTPELAITLFKQLGLKKNKIKRLICQAANVLRELNEDDITNLLENMYSCLGNSSPISKYNITFSPNGINNLISVEEVVINKLKDRLKVYDHNGDELKIEIKDGDD